MISKFLISGVVLSLIFFNGCKESYFPRLNEAQKVLVVEGLLTDESNVITISLSRTTPFQDQEFLPEWGADLYVNDDVDREFGFKEKEPGVYESKAFQYEYGRTYTLYIKTRDNKYYKSSPQTLFAKSELEPVNSIVKSETLKSTINGKLKMKTLQGLAFSTILNTASTSSPYFRFSNTVLVEYTQHVSSIAENGEFGLFYCWIKYSPNEFFNLNDASLNLTEIEHKLAFCPIDSDYFSIKHEDIFGGYPPSIVSTNDRDFYYFVITIKKYHLNTDVYQYYKAINDQLDAKNRIFDPISFQVPGNITCSSDPNEPVLGIFEVSSVSMRSYSFSNFLPDNTVKYEEIEPLEMQYLAGNGKFRINNLPSFWIYNYK